MVRWRRLRVLLAATTGAGLVGRLDELRVSAGVLSQSKACTEFPELDGCGS